MIDENGLVESAAMTSSVSQSYDAMVLAAAKALMEKAGVPLVPGYHGDDQDPGELARLGGYLARASDPPPGTIVMWRGMSRLTDIQIGVEIGAGDMGN